MQEAPTYSDIQIPRWCFREQWLSADGLYYIKRHGTSLALHLGVAGLFCKESITTVGIWVPRGESISERCRDNLQQRPRVASRSHSSEGW